MSEQDRLRAKLAHELAPLVAEAMYRVDKGSKLAQLADLLTDSTRKAYIDAALGALLGLQRTRINTVQSAIAQHHAEKAKPEEDVAAQARQDIANYGKDVH
jgi:hypothetical protein